MKISDSMKKVTRFGGIALCVMLAAAIMVLALTSCKEPQPDSPTYEVLSLLKEKKYVDAANLYNEKISGNEKEERLMEVLLEEYIAELDAQYRSGSLRLSDYTGHCWQVLYICRTNKLVEQTKSQLTTILNENYTWFMKVKDTDDGTVFFQVKKVFRDILDADLNITFWDAERQFAQMEAIHNARYDYVKGMAAEKLQTYDGYIEAMNIYKTISKDSVHYDEAQAAIVRCADAFRQMTLRVLETHYSNPESYSYRSGLEYGLDRIEDDLKILPGDEVLLAKQAEWKQKLLVCVRDEADKAMTDATMTYWNKWSYVAEALEYFPQDETLLAWRTSLVEPMKQEFYKTLRSRMGDPAYSHGDLIDGLHDRLPEDPDVQKLVEASQRYLSNKLNNFLYTDKQNIKFLYYPRRLPTTGPNGQALFANDPIADRHGVLHDPFNLYRVTASVNNPAIFRSNVWNTVSDLNRLTFTVDAAAGCGNGSAVIEVYTYDNATHDDAPKTKIYTSPVLNRNTKNLKVDVDLGSVRRIEVRVVAQSGSVTLLWDHAYLESVKPYEQW